MPPLTKVFPPLYFRRGYTPNSIPRTFMIRYQYLLTILLYAGKGS